MLQNVSREESAEQKGRVT